MLGAERVVLELSQRTREFGYESVILALQSPGDPEPELITLAREAGIQTEILVCQGRFDPRAASQIRRFVHDQRIDLLHSHGYKENFYALLARPGVPMVASNHLWKRTSRALRFYCWLDSKLIRHFDYVVAVSEPIRQEMLQAGVPAGKLSKIANGIDVEPFRRAAASSDREAVRASLGIAPDRLVVGMLSGLGREKGHIYALEAVARLREEFPDLVLAIVGDGPELPALQGAVARLGLSSHIRFCGRRRDVADVLSSFDVFLLPSLIEGLPMALLEAMATGRAAVTSRVGDVPAAIRDGHTGLLVPPADVAALANALARVLGDVELRDRLGRSAAEVIENEFSSRQMARQYCALYDRLQTAPGTVPARAQEE
jgi:glycosyltransferase involved in cell wall biosynthesis